MIERVVATDSALSLIKMLQERHGPIMFHQSGGCCDGSAPMCYPVGDFYIGSQDIRLGDIGGASFYMHKSQYDYWKHTQIIIDAIDGRGASFSLESTEGKAFISKARVFTEKELACLRHLDN